jgi:prolipoprotein diacylglyceryltransferase
MYPTLSDLINDLTGIYIPMPIQTFGFFLAISFLCAAWTLSLELKRKEKNGLIHPLLQKKPKGKPAAASDYAVSGLTGFFIGWKLLYILFHYSEFVNDTQGVILSSKGNIPGGLAMAALFVFFRYRESEKNKKNKPVMVEEKIHPYQLVGNMTVIAAVAGIIGAKIFHNLENINELMADPVDALLSFSGLTMYGGLIFGAIAVIWFGAKNNIPWYHLIDAAAPGLMLAYGTGRVGCHLSGDGDWGIVNVSSKPDWLSFLPDWMWGYHYPHNVISEGIPISGCEGRHCMMLPEPVLPTPFYEAVICISLFFVLWSIRKKISVPGILFSVYLIMNGTERFFIEKIRVNTKYHIFGNAITQAEIIAVCLFLLGLFGLFYFRKRSKSDGKTIV